MCVAQSFPLRYSRLRMRASFVAIRWRVVLGSVVRHRRGELPRRGAREADHREHLAADRPRDLEQPERARGGVPLLEQVEVGLRHVVGECRHLRKARRIRDPREGCRAGIERGAAEDVDLRAHEGVGQGKQVELHHHPLAVEADVREVGPERVARVHVHPELFQRPPGSPVCETASSTAEVALRASSPATRSTGWRRGRRPRAGRTCRCPRRRQAQKPLSVRSTTTGVPARSETRTWLLSVTSRWFGPTAP